jgi:hypothetical protein
MKDDPNFNIIKTRMEELEKAITELAKYRKPYAPNIQEAIQLLQDYNTCLTCRQRWHIANDVYMENPDAWARSNKMLADIHDALSDIEIRNGLITIPKNIRWDTGDLNYHPPVQEGQSQPQLGS